MLGVGRLVIFYSWSFSSILMAYWCTGMAYRCSSSFLVKSNVKKCAQQRQDCHCLSLCHSPLSSRVYWYSKFNVTATSNAKCNKNIIILSHAFCIRMFLFFSSFFLRLLLHYVHYYLSLFSACQRKEPGRAVSSHCLCNVLPVSQKSES